MQPQKGAKCAKSQSGTNLRFFGAFAAIVLFHGQEKIQ
jgi:hypothetical protein